MATLTLQPDGAAGIDTYIDKASADYSGTNVTYFQIKGFSTIISSGLIKFDLSTLAGATINSATFSLFGLGFGINLTLNIHRILAANSGWTEGATWNYANGSSIRWAGDTGGNGGNDAGCSVGGTDVSNTTMGSAAFSYTAGVETQFTLNTTEFGLMVAANYGMRIVSASGNATVCQPASSDNATAARRPKLVVDYTPAVTFRPWYAQRARLIGSM
jgi:hypothetical protein